MASLIAGCLNSDWSLCSPLGGTFQAEGAGRVCGAWLRNTKDNSKAAGVCGHGESGRSEVQEAGLCVGSCGPF